MYTDIHSHILVGADDGAKDNKTAVRMLLTAQMSGTAHIIAAPHFISGSLENDKKTIWKKCDDLRRLARGEGLSIDIYPGAEVFMCPNLLELLDEGIIFTLNDSFFILIELPTDSIPVYTDEILFSLQLRGLTPIIAHPERNLEIRRDPGILEDFISRGILAQANSGSITGFYGRRVKSAVMKFIGMGLIQFVGSDAHTAGRRSPNLRKAERIVRWRYGAYVSEYLFYKNGAAVIRNETVQLL
jgi:protein-tyrosine phosphatase